MGGCLVMSYIYAKIQRIVGVYVAFKIVLFRCLIAYLPRIFYILTLTLFVTEGSKRQAPDAPNRPSTTSPKFNTVSNIVPQPAETKGKLS